MKTQTVKKAFATLMLAMPFIFASCKQAEMLPATITKVEGVKIGGVTLTGLKGKMKVKICNPNPFEVKIFKSDLDVKLNDIPVGKAGLKRKIVVPANTEIEKELYFHPGYSKMGIGDVKNVAQMVKDQELRINLNGNLREGKRFNKTRVYVNETRTIDMKPKTKKVEEFFSMIGKKIDDMVKERKEKKKNKAKDAAVEKEKDPAEVVQ